PLVGLCGAKAYALAVGKPLYAVNHLAAHIAVDQLEHGPLPEPAIALLVSGGHSSLLLARDIAGDVQPLGATVDDAAGEAYDKVARVLGLGFPGGPPIDKESKNGDPAAIAFPRAMLHDGTLDFSFAGLKTAVARWVEAKVAQGESVPVADVAASFQEAVVDVLTRKAVAACREHGVDHLVSGGGRGATTSSQVPSASWASMLRVATVPDGAKGHTMLCPMAPSGTFRRGSAWWTSDRQEPPGAPRPAWVSQPP